MYFSNLHRVENAKIAVDPVKDASTLGQYVIRIDSITNIYLTEHEARTLHNALFDAIHPFPSQPSTNVKVLP